MVVAKLEEAVKLLQGALEDAEKVERGNRSAATRLRKDCSEVSKLLKELRAIVLDTVKEAKESK